MKGHSLSFSFFFSLYFSLFYFSLLRDAKANDEAQNNGVYAVQMGAAAASRNGTLRDDHTQLLNSLSPGGFAARLSKEEADSIARRPGVVLVFPDTLLKLHTTRSWDFLNYQADLEMDSGHRSDSNIFSQESSSDTIIGILDTGIWPESPSFADNGMGPIPSRWKGTSMEAQDFSSSHCNRKSIGARYYFDPDWDVASALSPRDMEGHGTHVASTAAGIPVPGASYYGLAKASLEDGSWSTATAIGSFHAVEKGVAVVCAAGNSGPWRGTLANIAPWILTVGATTIDRDFVLAWRHTFWKPTKVSQYPLIYGLDAKGSGDLFYKIEDFDARNCNPGTDGFPPTLDENKIRGRITVCEHSDYRYAIKQKLEIVISQGGTGVILVVDHTRRVASSAHRTSTISAITESDGTEVLSYIRSSRNPVPTILPMVSVAKHKPAPIVAAFSSRGPAYKIKQLLKPDIAAPGVDILAVWPNTTSEALEKRDPPLFYLLSGTSMSCPHIAGIAAAVKSQYRTWSPSAIKSTIMTTASQTNNMKAPITTGLGSVATPCDYGAGEVTTTGPLQLGLIYETNTVDYLQFLCNLGYDASQIKSVSLDLYGFSCPKDQNAHCISDMNYPSIAVSNFKGRESRRVVRTATNVGVCDETVYTATVEAPTGWEVKVIPEKLQFTKEIKKLSYEVIFTSETSPEEDVFGSVTRTNGKYRVQNPFVLSS